MSASALEPVGQPTAVAPGHGTEAATPRRLGSHRLPLGRLAIRAGALASCLLAWHLAAVLKLDLGFVTFRNVPAPAEAAWAFWSLLQSPKLSYHLGTSLIRVLGGFAAALALGIGLGLAVGRYRLARDLLLPPLEVLRPIPAVAWIPLAILMFPSSELSMMFITFTGALFPILLNTVHGVEGVDPPSHCRRRAASARETGRSWARSSCRAPRPSIVTGAAIGMGTAWFCLVTAEMISGQYGIGYFTWESYTLQRLRQHRRRHAADRPARDGQQRHPESCRRSRDAVEPDRGRG